MSTINATSTSLGQHPSEASCSIATSLSRTDSVLNQVQNDIS